MIPFQPGSAREELVHHAWSMQCYPSRGLQTASGKKIRIHYPGVSNIHAGPDFLFARIQIGAILWVGNVELHERASDWYRHRHHLDPAYNNVILHVVHSNNAAARNTLGRSIETLVWSPGENWMNRFDRLLADSHWLPCHSWISKVPAEQLKEWLVILYQQRVALQSSRANIYALAGRKGEREQNFLISMARGFGLPANSLPMELLARKIPCRLIREVAHDEIGLESLLFGISGLLKGSNDNNSYPCDLFRRFGKFTSIRRIPAIPKHLWKFFRMRPASFPTLRIAQFARLIHLRQPLWESIAACNTIMELEQKLRIKAGPYWDTHYQFGIDSPPSEKYTGKQFIRSILINVIIPFQYSTGLTAGSKRALQIMNELESESNHIIKRWRQFGVEPANALESQALIQLHREYCSQKRCIECRLGRRYLRDTANDQTEG